MAEITTELIKELRDKTGVSVMQCKKALEETGGNLEEALLVLRKISSEMAAKKADRVANDGAVAVRATNGKAALATLHSETDFVAQNTDFVNAVEKLTETILEKGLSVAKEEAEKDTKELVLKIGENIIPGEMASVEGEHVGTYLHHNRKAGTIVALSGGTDELAKDIAMHIAAMNPLYVKETDIPEEERTKIVAFFEKEVAESDKPEDLKKKMLDGKVTGYFKEQTLLEQPFFKNPDITVGKLLEDAGAQVETFVRVKLG